MTGCHRGSSNASVTLAQRTTRLRTRDPSADHHELPLPALCDSLHYPLRRPVIDPDDLAAALIDTPSRVAASTAITVSTGCVVTPDSSRSAASNARSASSACAVVCADPCADATRLGTDGAEICTRSGADGAGVWATDGCTARLRAGVGADALNCVFAPCTGRCTSAVVRHDCLGDAFP